MAAGRSRGSTADLICRICYSAVPSFRPNISCESIQSNLQRFRSQQGFSFPTRADERKHAMLHQVPLADLWRMLTNSQADVQWVRESLDLILPAAASATVAAAAVGAKKPLGGLGIVSQFPLPNSGSHTCSPLAGRLSRATRVVPTIKFCVVQNDSSKGVWPILEAPVGSNPRHPYCEQLQFPEPPLQIRSRLRYFHWHHLCHFLHSQTATG